MNQDDVTRLALTYGADLSRWPADARADAKRLIQSSPELELVLRGAAQLDAALEDQRSDVPEHRLTRLKAAALARARSKRAAANWSVGFSAARIAALSREWSWATVGFACAACVVAMLQLALSANAAVAQSPIVSLLEYDSGMLEMIR